eukprot:6172375-Pleurochrysis_carterae.AAC.1
MCSGSPIRSGGWTRCNPQNLGAGLCAARPPPPPLVCPLKEIHSGDGGWVNCARWLRHGARCRSVRTSTA